MSKPTIAVCITSLGATKNALAKAYRDLEPFTDYFDVIFDNGLIATDRFGSRPVDDRIESLTWAVENGDIIMAWDGGFNSIELLGRLDELPVTDKPFVGYSDNTVLGNALAATGKCRFFYGPVMDDVVNKPRRRRQIAESLMSLYKDDSGSMTVQYNEAGPKTVQAGNMTGKIWGGNNYSFDLLPGTPFSPTFDTPYILFMEGEDILKQRKYVWRDFIRNIDAIMLLPGAQDNLQGIIIGRFPSSYRLKKDDVRAFVQARSYLKNVPIVIDFPCGHSSKNCYLPIGQTVRIALRTDNTMKVTL